MNDRRPPHDPENDMPPEDDLLEAVGEMARDDEATTPRRELLRRLVAGEATEEEIAALEREAETSEEARRDLEAFRPLGPELRERIVESLPKKTAEVTPFPTSDASAPVPPRPMRGAWIPLAAAALLAVAAGLWWLVEGVPGPSADFELAAYSPELSGQVRDQRSGDVEPEDLPTFEMGSTFRLVLRPETASETDPDFDFYLASEDGVLRPWDVGYARSAEGTVKIEGVLGEDLEISPGTWTFVFVWGEPGELPEPTTLDDVADDAGPWRALSVPFRVVPGEMAYGELPLEVEYAGCFEVLPGPVCVPYPEMTFWVRSPADAAIELRVGDQTVSTSGEPVDGGLRFRFPVEAADGEVVVAVTAGSRSARFRLPLTLYGAPPWLHRARSLSARGEDAEARHLLETHGDSAPERFRGAILGLLARAAPSEEESIAHLETAMEHHRRQRSFLRLAEDLGMLLYFDVKNRRFARLRQRLDEIDAELPPRLPAEAQFHLFYYRGILEGDVGNYRSALPALRRAADLASRVDLPAQRAKAHLRLALTLQRLGETGRAAALLRQVAEEPAFPELPPCLQARFHNTHGWISIFDEGVSEDPLQSFDAALAVATKCGGSLSLNLYLNRAIAWQAKGRTWEARRALVEAQAHADSAGTLHRLWWNDLEGRIALDEGRALDALEHFRAMEVLADAAFEPPAAWRSRIGVARAYELLDAPEEALDAYAEAEQILESQTFQVPIEVGRERYVATHEADMSRYLDLLLRLGRNAEALDVARRTRSRVLRSLRRGHRLADLGPERQAIWDLEIGRYLDRRARIAEMSDDWRVDEMERGRLQVARAELRVEALRSLDRAFEAMGAPAGEIGLPALDPRELVLVFHPLPVGWVGFAVHDGEISTHRFELHPEDLGSGDALGRHLLEPFDGMVESSARIRVLPYGQLRQVDVHALPWRGDALLVRKSVVYGLDLHSSPKNRRRDDGGVLLVADPRRDLPAARHEGDVAESVLRRGSDVGVERLDGSRATLEEVRSRLSRVEFLHFAGHGIGGDRGHALLLAGDEHMTVGDILALPRAPSKVILSSCESARAAGLTVTGLGLAQAFLVAGTEAVVAALRPVGDRDTTELFRRFYEESTPSDLEASIRKAQLAWRAQDPSADWSSFRLLVP